MQRHSLKRLPANGGGTEACPISLLSGGCDDDRGVASSLDKVLEIKIIPQPLPVIRMEGDRYCPFLKDGRILFPNISWN